MEFFDFIKRLSSAIRAGSSTSAFTKSVIESILTEEGQAILEEYSDSSFKGFYNGNTAVTRLANKVNAYIEPMNFSEYINQFSDAAVQNLCGLFSDVLPDINPHNASELLADLFVSILTAAAGTNKKSTPKGADIKLDGQLALITDQAVLAPDISQFKDGVLYIGAVPDDESSNDPFKTYLEKAVEYYSLKKTLLNPEKPRNFYDIYVCNDLRYHKWRVTGARDPKPEITISDGTVERLESESKYIIIEGTGGIGKSMFLTHLFLSSAESYGPTDELPVLISLKDYKEETTSIVEFIWRTVNAFDASVTQKQIIEALEEKRLALLMDGLDEIQSSLRESFNTDLEAFIKSYPGNTIFITSRPVYSFVSYTRFSLFDLEPLTKEQALALIKKLEFWDEKAKADFIIALDRNLYWSHYQFASNPLLLTIMLMTYSSFGEVPAKMHVFYSKAYETMARLHDATKGSFKRPLNTKMTPEEFARHFAQFCARTYTDEIFDFDERTFSSYMDKVLKGTAAKENGVIPRDFLLDLTDNLCIMYQEGSKYYFIHRSFQEYFAAVYFASDYDAKLKKVGNFFEKQQHRSFSDRTFGMLYDMIPEKVERYIFLPFLESLIVACAEEGKTEEYWAFLESQYPALYYEEGRTDNGYVNEPQSFLYKTIVREKRLGSDTDLDLLTWPKQLLDLPRKNWVTVYREFMEADAYGRNPDPDDIDDADLEETDIVGQDDVYYRYADYFGEPEVEGFTIEIEIYELRKNPGKYAELRSFMESAEFPLMEEYRNIKRYYAELKARTEKENESDDLFED